jgi:hypothetical protein
MMPYMSTMFYCQNNPPGSLMQILLRLPMPIAKALNTLVPRRMPLSRKETHEHGLLLLKPEFSLPQ